MNQITAIDAVYVLTLLWNVLYPILRQIFPIVLNTVLSRYISTIQYRALIDEPEVLDLLSKSIFKVVDVDSINKLSSMKLMTFYPNGLLTIVKLSSGLAIMYIDPVDKPTDKNSVPVRTVRLFLSKKTALEYAKSVTETVARNVVSSRFFFLTNNGSTRTICDMDTIEIINSPGVGCNNHLFDLLESRCLYIRDNATRLKNKNLPVGSSILLVGPPGTGKTSIVTHAALKSGSRCVSILEPETLGDLPDTANAHIKASGDGFKLVTENRISRFEYEKTNVVLVNDIDRLIKSKIVTTSEILSVLDLLSHHACLVVFTANSITPFDPAVLSRLQVEYVPFPVDAQVIEHVKLYHDHIHEDKIHAWVKEISGEVKDLRLLRRCLVSMSAEETLPQAWRRILKEEAGSKLLAESDGDTYVKQD